MMQPRCPKDPNSNSKSWIPAACALVVVFSASITASAATLVVGDCLGAGGYSTIQQAVDSAAAGDTVRVCPATYAETILIDKNLTLDGITSIGKIREKSLPTIIYANSEDRPCLDGVCPQIFVRSAVNVSISHLNIDGSNYPSTVSCPSLEPAGIAFDDAGGSVTHTDITNHLVACEGEAGVYAGLGVYLFPLDVPESLNVSDNTISTFGDSGIFMAFNQNNAVLTGSVVNNQISSTIVASGMTGINISESNGFTILGNNISAPGSDGIVLGGSTNAGLALNVVSNFHSGFRFDNNSSANVAVNSVANAANGMAVYCNANSSFVGNTIKGQSPAPLESRGFEIEDTQDVGGCTPVGDNRIAFNVIDSFCAGILQYDTIGGTTVEDNIFQNIGPGMDIMFSETCP